MKQLIVASVCGLLVSGCAGSSDSQRDRMLIGGGLGAATGATIGAAAGSTAGAAIAGAAIGAIGGGLIGMVTAPKKCIARDQNGNTYQVTCP